MYERKRGGPPKSEAVSSIGHSKEHCKGSPGPRSQPRSDFSLQRTSGESQDFGILRKRDPFLPQDPMIFKNMWSAFYLKFFLTVFFFFFLVAEGSVCPFHIILPFVSTLPPGGGVYWYHVSFPSLGQKSELAYIHTWQPRDGGSKKFLVAPIQNVCLFCRTSHSDSSIYIRRHANRSLESVSM